MRETGEKKRTTSGSRGPSFLISPLGNKINLCVALGSKLYSPLHFLSMNQYLLLATGYLIMKSIYILFYLYIFLLLCLFHTLDRTQNKLWLVAFHINQLVSFCVKGWCLVRTSGPDFMQALAPNHRIILIKTYCTLTNDQSR